MKSEKVTKITKITNFYWPLLGGEWKILRSYCLNQNTSPRLADWEKSHFAWKFLPELNDCATCNSGYLACLDSLEISSVESIEILRLIRSLEEEEKSFDSKNTYHNQKNSNIYLELMIKEAEISEEALVDVYIKSRYSKWSNSSVESKYRISMSLLNQ